MGPAPWLAGSHCTRRAGCKLIMNETSDMTNAGVHLLRHWLWRRERLQGLVGKMTRRLPRMLSQLQPHSLPASLPAHHQTSLPLLTTPSSRLQPARQQEPPPSVFCPTSFPPLRAPSYYPTLKISMPSNSRLSAKRTIRLPPLSCYSSFLVPTPPNSPIE